MRCDRVPRWQRTQMSFNSDREPQLQQKNHPTNEKKIKINNFFFLYRKSSGQTSGRFLLYRKDSAGSSRKSSGQTEVVPPGEALRRRPKLGQRTRERVFGSSAGSSGKSSGQTGVAARGDALPRRPKLGQRTRQRIFGSSAGSPVGPNIVKNPDENQKK